MYGHFISKCFNLNTKKLEAIPYLVDAQEVGHLQSFSQSPSTLQSCITNCLSISNTSDGEVWNPGASYWKLLPKQDFMQI